MPIPMRLIFVILSIALIAACSPSTGQEKGAAGKKGGGPGGMPPPEVAVVSVEAKSLPVAFEYTGQTAGSREAEVRARVGGILLKRNVTEVARGRKGQSLYSIDPAPFEAVAARAEAHAAADGARDVKLRRNGRPRRRRRATADGQAQFSRRAHLALDRHARGARRAAQSAGRAATGGVRARGP